MVVVFWRRREGPRWRKGVLRLLGGRVALKSGMRDVTLITPRVVVLMKRGRARGGPVTLISGERGVEVGWGEAILRTRLIPTLIPTLILGRAAGAVAGPVGEQVVVEEGGRIVPGAIIKRDRVEEGGPVMGGQRGLVLRQPRPNLSQPLMGGERGLGGRLLPPPGNPNLHHHHHHE